MVERQQLKISRPWTDQFPTFRVRYGKGATHYSLSHPLPTLFRETRVEHHEDTRRGLLCFTMGTYVRFFVCWTNMSKNSSDIYCSIHSPEQLLGTKRYTRDVELPKSSKSFYCRARALAMETLSAVERRCHYPRITRVPISDELVQYVGVRWEKASFLGRDCHDIVIEEMSELDYSYSQDDEGSDSLSKGTNIVPGKTPVEGGRSPTGSEDGSTTSSDTEDVQEQ
jgi:hypothetical protein